MAYEIRYLAKTECLIEYVVDKNSDRKKFWTELPLMILGIIALLIGTDFLLLLVGIPIAIFVLLSLRPRRRTFEIKINRDKNLISVNTTEQGRLVSMTYPLSSFEGFGRHELKPAKLFRTTALAELFFKFDDGIENHSVTSKNALTNIADRGINADGTTFWNVPIQKIQHPTLLKNAEKIIADIERWLGQPTGEKRLDEPSPEANVMRDFRDVETPETEIP